MSDDDRYVGRAGLPPPEHYDPPTEPLVLVPQRKPRPVALIAGLVAAGFLLCVIGVIAGFAVRFGGIQASDAPAEQQAQPPPKAPPAVSPTPSQDGPRAVTEKFFVAVHAGDKTGINQHLCALLRNDGESPAPANSELSWLSLGALVSYKVGEEKVNAVGASVGVELTLPLIGAGNWEVYLVREGGGWRVCGAAPA